MKVVIEREMAVEERRIPPLGTVTQAGSEVKVKVAETTRLDGRHRPGVNLPLRIAPQHSTNLGVDLDLALALDRLALDQGETRISALESLVALTKVDREQGQLLYFFALI